MGLLTFYFFVNPLSTKWMPQCVFHKLTGLQCMGCGAQRMVHALLHGNIVEAMQANYLLFFSLPALGFLMYVELTRLRHPMLYAKMHSLPAIIGVSVVLAVWFVLRNILSI